MHLQLEYRVHLVSYLHITGYPNQKPSHLPKIVHHIPTPSFEREPVIPQYLILHNVGNIKAKP